jgi:hypothetical protein
MTTLTHEIFIAAPPATVWAKLADLINISPWHSYEVPTVVAQR